MVGAAYGGYLDIVDLCKKKGGGAQNYKKVTARCGHTDIMYLE